MKVTTFVVIFAAIFKVSFADTSPSSTTENPGCSGNKNPVEQYVENAIGFFQTFLSNVPGIPKVKNPENKQILETRLVQQSSPSSNAGPIPFPPPFPPSFSSGFPPNFGSGYKPPFTNFPNFPQFPPYVPQLPPISRPTRELQDLFDNNEELQNKLEQLAYLIEEYQNVIAQNQNEKN